MSELQIHDVVLVPVAKIKLDPSNPNEMSKEQMNGLRESFRRFGYLDPVILDENYTVADGEHRLQIFREFGKTEIPCYILKLTDAERRMLRQTKNKLHGSHNPKMDAAEIKFLYDQNLLAPLATLIAADQKNLVRLLESQKLIPFIREDDAPSEFEKRVSPGQLWQLGRHRLLCGDSTNVTHLNTLIQSDSIAVLWTDPPYGVDYDKGNQMAEDAGFKRWGKIEGDKTPEVFVNFIHAIAERIRLASWYICTSNRHLEDVIGAIKQHEIHIATPIIWLKENFSPSWERYHAQHEVIIFAGDASSPTGKYSVWYGPNNETTIWQIHRDNTSTYVHPTQKPIALVTRALINSSTKNDVVLDAFGGSGTTLIACEQINRRALIMELDPHYCDVIIGRWEKFTGQKAQLLNSAPEASAS
jgi:DNA modification methylase